MTARVLRFPAPEPPVDRRMSIAEAQRIWLAVEDAVAGEWSDSILIAQLVHASPLERGAIIRQLEARAWRKRP